MKTTAYICMFLVCCNRGLSGEVLQGPFPDAVYRRYCHARRWCQWQGGATRSLRSSVPEHQYASFVQCVPGQARDCQLLFFSPWSSHSAADTMSAFGCLFSDLNTFQVPLSSLLIRSIINLVVKHVVLLASLILCDLVESSFLMVFKNREQFLWHTLAQQHLWSGLGRGPAGRSGDIEGLRTGIGMDSPCLNL